jgi:hypothetical protein
VLGLPPHASKRLQVSASTGNAFSLRAVAVLIGHDGVERLGQANRHDKRAVRREREQWRFRHEFTRAAIAAGNAPGIGNEEIRMSPSGKNASAHGSTSLSLSVTTRIRARSVTTTKAGDVSGPAVLGSSGVRARSSMKAAPSPTTARTDGTIRCLFESNLALAQAVGY